jgi:hypothetical protein
LSRFDGTTVKEKAVPSVNQAIMAGLLQQQVDVTGQIAWDVFEEPR